MVMENWLGPQGLGDVVEQIPLDNRIFLYVVNEGKVYMPLKPGSARLESVVARNRPPNLMKCLPWAIEV